MSLQKEPSTGIVKWFNRKKGFGFITPDDNSGDVFLHISALTKAEIRMVDAGTHMTFFTENGDKGLTAVNATLVDSRSGKTPEKKAEAQRKESTAPKRPQNKSDSARLAKKQERIETPAIEVPAKESIAPKRPQNKSESARLAKKQERIETPAIEVPAKESIAPKRPQNKSDSSRLPKKKERIEAPAIEVPAKESIAPKRPQKKSDNSRLPKKKERIEAPAIEVPAKLPGSDLAGDAGTFTDLGLMPSLLQAVEDAGYVEPTPIQTKAIPHVLAGKDLLGCAQTGTGKTAAFALPILQRLSGKQVNSQDPKTSRKQAQRRVIRALILAPTRELAIQIGESFTTYGKYTGLKNCVVFGGVGQDPQVKALEHGIDILVATPGRLLDLIGQKYINLDHVEVLVLDEADRMLDMGFIHDVNRIIKLVPARRQGLLFSATIPKEISDLAKSFLVKPVEITIAPDQPTLDTIKQSLYFVARKKKGLLLIDLLKNKDIFTRTLVFTRTKHEANRVVKILTREGIPAMPIHGNKSQTARQKALGDFKDGTIRVLVATDVASRGIDVYDISHVIQYDLPNVPETYVHRMGRTGRMGVAGISIAFCDETEKQCLIDIEKFIRMRVPVIKKHPFMD